MYFLNNPKEILDIDNKEDIDYFKYLLKMSSNLVEKLKRWNSKSC